MNLSFFNLVNDKRTCCKLNHQLLELFNIIINSKSNLSIEENIKKYQDSLISQLDYLDFYNHIDDIFSKFKLKLSMVPEKEWNIIRDYYDRYKRQGVFPDYDKVFQELIQIGVYPKYVIAFVNGLKSHEFVEYPGIKSLSYQDIKYLYQAIVTYINDIYIEDLLRYNCYMLDSDRENTKAIEYIDKFIVFAKTFNKRLLGGPLIYYQDFPSMLKNKRKEQVNSILEHYLTLLIIRYHDKISTLEVFREFVSDEVPFHLENHGWQSILSIKDFCQMLLPLKQEYPNLNFIYSEDKVEYENSIEGELKCDVIKRVIEQIKGIEVEYHAQNKLPQEQLLLDQFAYLGHFNLKTDLDNIQRSFASLSSMALSLNILEFEIERNENDLLYPDKNSPYALGLQMSLIREIINIVKKYKIQVIGIRLISDKLSSTQTVKSPCFDQNMFLKPVNAYHEYIEGISYEAIQVRGVIEKILLLLPKSTNTSIIFSTLEDNSIYQQFINHPNNQLFRNCFISAKKQNFIDKYEFIHYITESIDWYYAVDPKRREAIYNYLKRYH